MHVKSLFSAELLEVGCLISVENWLPWLRLATDAEMMACRHLGAGQISLSKAQLPAKDKGDRFQHTC